MLLKWISRFDSFGLTLSHWWILWEHSSGLHIAGWCTEGMKSSFCTEKWGLMSAERCSRVDVIRIVFLKWLVCNSWAHRGGIKHPGSSGGLQRWEQEESQPWSCGSEQGRSKWGMVALETKGRNWLFFLQSLVTGGVIRGEMQMWKSSGLLQGLFSVWIRNSVHLPSLGSLHSSQLDKPGSLWTLLP